jgi:hypothetical protein
MVDVEGMQLASVFGTAWNVLACVVAISVLLLVIAFVVSVFRERPSSLKLKLLRWFSIEADWRAVPPSKDDEIS